MSETFDGLLGHRVIALYERYQYRFLFKEERGVFGWMEDVSMVIDHDGDKIKEEIAEGNGLFRLDKFERMVLEEGTAWIGKSGRRSA